MLRLRRDPHHHRPHRRRFGRRCLALTAKSRAGGENQFSTAIYRTSDQSMVRSFIERLKAAGVNPDEVITDDSRLYPAVLKEIWPAAMHQLCLFHATRRVVRAVSDVVKQVRRTLPTPPPVSAPTLLGSLRRTPPAADQHDPDSERYRWRLARRTLGIAQVHALHQQISSARATGRQLGINHGTVRQWLRLTPPDPA